MSRSRKSARQATAAALHSTALRLLRAVRGGDAAFLAAPAQLSALSVLAFRSPLSVQELARIEQVSLPTVSRVLASLENAGHIVRDFDEADRRRILASITPAGRAVFDAARGERLKRVARVLEDFSEAELATLDGLLEKLAETLGPRR